MQTIARPSSYLPHELFLHVFSYLQGDEINNACLVCKLWNNLASDRVFWKTADLADCLTIRKSTSQSWKQFYLTNIQGATINRIYTLPDHIYAASGICMRIWKRIHHPSFEGFEYYQQTTDHSATITCFDIDSYDNFTYLVTGSADKTIKIWKMLYSTKFYLSKTLSGHLEGITAIQAKYHHIVSGSRDNTVKIWEMIGSDSIECVSTLLGHTKTVSNICIGRPDLSLIFTASYDHTVRIWERSAPNQYVCTNVLFYLSEQITSIAYDVYHDYLFIGSSKGTVKIFKHIENEFSFSKWVLRQTINFTDRPIQSIVYFTDNFSLYIATDSEVYKYQKAHSQTEWSYIRRTACEGLVCIQKAREYTHTRKIFYIAKKILYVQTEVIGQPRDLTPLLTLEYV